MNLVELGERWNGREVDGGGEEGLGRGVGASGLLNKANLKVNAKAEKEGVGGCQQNTFEKSRSSIEVAQYLPKQLSKTEFGVNFWM